MKTIKKILNKICVAKMICNHLISKEHTLIHRCTIGFVIMGSGVMLTKGALFFDSGFIHWFADLVGYGIHGIGAIPFVDSVLKDN